MCIYAIIVVYVICMLCLMGFLLVLCNIENAENIIYQKPDHLNCNAFFSIAMFCYLHKPPSFLQWHFCFPIVLHVGRCHA